MTRRRTSLLMAVAVLFTVAGVVLQWYRQQPPISPAVAALFGQTLADATGRPQRLSQWQGRPVLVNFWATWCPPCVQEMPELSALQKQRSANLQIIGIGIDSPSNIRDFSQRLDLSYPVLVGGIDATELARTLGNQSGGLPYTVLIDARGQVRKTYRGRLKMPELAQDLDQINR